MLPAKPLKRLVCLLLAAAAPAAAGRWIDDESWGEHTTSVNSKVAQHAHEKVLSGRFAATGYPFEAQALAVALPAPPDALETALGEILGARLDPATRVELSDVTLSAAWGTSPIDSQVVRDRFHGEWATAIRALGFDPDRPLSGRRLKSRPYNLLPSRDGSSQATILILDGAEPQARPCSLVVLYRTDRARQWGIPSIHQPYPLSYKARAVDLVTASERTWLDRLASRFPGSSSIEPVDSARSWFRSLEVWKSLRGVCGGG